MLESCPRSLRALALIALSPLLVAAWPVSTLAQDAEGGAAEQDGEDVEEVEPPWSGQVELGFVSTSGNTETATVNGRLELAHERGPWRFTTSLDALRASDDERTTAEQYLVGGQAEYALTERDYLFATVNYTDDRFSGFDYRVSEAVGYGRRLVSTGSLEVKAEIGAGARQSRLAEGGDERDAIVRGNGEAEWEPREGLALSQEISIESGADGTVARSTSGLLTELFGGLAAKISFALEHTSAVPAGVEKTDSLTSVSLVYGF